MFFQFLSRRVNVVNFKAEVLPAENAHGSGQGNVLARLRLPDVNMGAGQVEYLDLLEGVTLVERMDEVTGLTSRVVVDYKQAAKGVDLRPRLQLKDDNGDLIYIN